MNKKNMEYSQFKNSAAKITEMCEPITIEEERRLIDLGAELAVSEQTNNTFAKEYDQELTRAYLEWCRNKQCPNNTYKRYTFSRLDKEIRERLSHRNHNKEIPLLPEYTKTEYTQKDTSSPDILKRIAKMKKNNPEQ